MSNEIKSRICGVAELNENCYGTAKNLAEEIISILDKYVIKLK